jgi:hypothetical protein
MIKAFNFFSTFTHEGERTVVKALLTILCNGQRGENGKGWENELHVEIAGMDK